MLKSTLGLAAAAALLAPAAVQAAKPPKLPAKLTIAAAPSAVTFGRATTLSGKLSGGKSAAGQLVAVQADTAPFDGTYTDVATAKTDANGDWSATNAPTALTRYRAQAKTAPPATSATVDVGVRLRVGIRVSDRTPARGQRVRFSGTVAPAHDGAPVRIQRRRADGSWRTVARTTLQDAGDAVSRYAKRVKVTRTGTYRVRAASGDGDHLRGTSATRRLRVAAG
ncbi:MAG: hypothetical protein QOK21_1630 [Solirubrobacteraceae bacterium]|jgi:hypothetical protein|nr:hypothetical protein [Solirubrobacteraceae bacterium]